MVNKQRFGNERITEFVEGFSRVLAFVISARHAAKSTWIEVNSYQGTRLLYLIMARPYITSIDRDLRISEVESCKCWLAAAWWGGQAQHLSILLNTPSPKQRIWFPHSPSVRDLLLACLSSALLLHLACSGGESATVGGQQRWDRT